MRVATEKSFNVNKPEEYAWWNFVEPIEVRCIALSLIIDIKETLTLLDKVRVQQGYPNASEVLKEEESNYEFRLSSQKAALRNVAHVAYTEKGYWGKRD